MTALKNFVESVFGDTAFETFEDLTQEATRTLAKWPWVSRVLKKIPVRVIRTFGHATGAAAAELFRRVPGLSPEETEPLALAARHVGSGFGAGLGDIAQMDDDELAEVWDKHVDASVQKAEAEAAVRKWLFLKDYPYAGIHLAELDADGKVALDEHGLPKSLCPEFTRLIEEEKRARTKVVQVNQGKDKARAPKSVLTGKPPVAAATLSEAARFVKNGHCEHCRALPVPQQLFSSAGKDAPKQARNKKLGDMKKASRVIRILSAAALTSRTRGVDHAEPDGILEPEFRQAAERAGEGVCNHLATTIKNARIRDDGTLDDDAYRTVVATLGLRSPWDVRAVRTGRSVFTEIWNRLSDAGSRALNGANDAWNRHAWPWLRASARVTSRATKSAVRSLANFVLLLVLTVCLVFAIGLAAPHVLGPGSGIWVAFGGLVAVIGLLIGGAYVAIRKLT